MKKREKQLRERKGRERLDSVRAWGFQEEQNEERSRKVRGIVVAA